MNARSLAAQGVSIDPQTGKVQGSLSSIFRDNPLVGSSPALSKQLARYVSSYDGWLNGIDLGAKRTEGTQIAPSGSPYDMARSNLVNLRPVPGKPGVFENDFLRNDNGTVTFKSQDEIKRTDQLRKDQLSAAVGTSLRSKNDPILGPRMVDGKKVISGSQLPATMGALQHFGPWIQSIANTFRNDAGQGGVYRMKVNRVGTGETGSYKVINLGNIRSITRNFWEPFEYSVSSQGHLLAHTIDDSAVQRNVLKGINEGLLPHHNNDAASVRQSMMTYLSNHKQGLPSENGIGIGKRNEINALLTSFSKNHRNLNPLASNFGPQGVVRRLRMDRIEDMNRVVDQDKNSATYGQPLAGFHFDYFKVNNNMMPDFWHGSPHDFDQFDTSKIGTGEGNQTYGHGLYGAENRAVAEVYGQQVKGKDRIDGINKRMSELVDIMDQSRIPGSDKYRTEEGRSAKAEYDRLMEEKLRTGNLYKAHFDAEPHELLDWDKPLSEQSDFVKAQLKDAPGMLFTGPETTGQVIYNTLVNNSKIAPSYETPKVRGRYASEYLASKGIKGIRFLDQFSRKDNNYNVGLVTPDEYVVWGPDRAELSPRFKTRAAALSWLDNYDAPGTRNFVIFDAKHTKVLEKNGKPVQ
jgi:hypothetical protein